MSPSFLSMIVIFFKVSPGLEEHRTFEHRATHILVLELYPHIEYVPSRMRETQRQRSQFA